MLSNRVNEFAAVIEKSICTNSSSLKIDLESALTQVMAHLRKLKKENHTLYLIGNGGSASVASHALVDFANVAKIKTQVLHESALITCIANDYGYENVYSQILSTYITAHDMLIAISSSGKSLNIRKVAQAAKERGAMVISLTGFNEYNPLRQLGDFNFWLNSTDYGYVEVGHQFILHNLADRFAVEKMQAAQETEEERAAICV